MYVKRLGNFEKTCSHRVAARFQSAWQSDGQTVWCHPSKSSSHYPQAISVTNVPHCTKCFSVPSKSFVCFKAYWYCCQLLSIIEHLLPVTYEGRRTKMNRCFHSALYRVLYCTKHIIALWVNFCQSQNTCCQLSVKDGLKSIAVNCVLSFTQNLVTPNTQNINLSHISPCPILLSNPIPPFQTIKQR